MTGPVPVPACPPPATPAPQGVIPGELCRWRLHPATIVLGIRNDTPWVAIHGGLGGGPLLEDPQQIADVAEALHTAATWLAHTRAEPEPDPEPQQATLWEAAS